MMETKGMKGSLPRNIIFTLKIMNVLSLFDGMSCGRIALERAMAHPSVVEFRTDKHEADSYETIQAIEDAAKGLIKA